MRWQRRSGKASGGYARGPIASAAVVDFTDGRRDPFLNVNTPDDLAAAERLLVRDL